MAYLQKKIKSKKQLWHFFIFLSYSIVVASISMWLKTIFDPTTPSSVPHEIYHKPITFNDIRKINIFKSVADVVNIKFLNVDDVRINLIIHCPLDGQSGKANNDNEVPSNFC